MLHVTSRLRLVVTAQYYNLGLRYILRRYSAVEIEAVASLRIDPLTPYLAPDNPFATRRAAELAERQRQRAPHRSILVRWGIGVITVSGDTATAAKKFGVAKKVSWPSPLHITAWDGFTPSLMATVASCGCIPMRSCTPWATQEVSGHPCAALHATNSATLP